MSKTKTAGTKNYTDTKLPDCSGYKAYVVSGAFYGDVCALMAQSGFQRAEIISDADVVVFVGGADINPAMYGEKPHKTTSFSHGRDTIENAVYDQCIAAGIPMFGICRGAQLLHARNGGKLWQDVNNHAGLPHSIVDIEDDVRVSSTSLHHQMLKLNDNITVIAVTEYDVASTFADESMTFRTSVDMKKFTNQPMEIEAGCYFDTGCFFVQGHPEIGCAEYRSWTMNKLLKFLVDWRMKQKDPTVTEILRQLS